VPASLSKNWVHMDDVLRVRKEIKMSLPQLWQALLTGLHQGDWVVKSLCVFVLIFTIVALCFMVQFTLVILTGRRSKNDQEVLAIPPTPVRYPVTRRYSSNGTMARLQDSEPCRWEYHGRDK